jgi:hypothetical protein
VIALFLVKLKGTLGTVGTIGMMLPVPEIEDVESPMALKAITLALSDVPVKSEKGLALKTSVGIWQAVAEMIFESVEASQLTRSDCQLKSWAYTVTL